MNDMIAMGENLTRRPGQLVQRKKAGGQIPRGDATANYHTEAVLGYLTAVLDSLHEDNPACYYLIDGKQFCGTFKSFMKMQDASGRTSFSHARAAIAENFDCGEKSKSH